MKSPDETQSLKLALGVYSLVFSMKLIVYFMTGIMALFAEALHTLSDIFISSFLLVAAIYSKRKPDEIHMFGYGRAQNVAALVSATLFISFTSFELYREAIPRVFQPEEATYQNVPLAVGVIIVSMIIAAAPLIKLLRQGARGAAANAQLIELINDELGLLAALIGTLFIVWDRPLADPIAAIIVATIIGYNAIGLFRENLSFLLGQSPGPEWLARMKRVARSVPGVLGVLDLRAEYVGPDTVHADIHIEVRQGLPIEEANRIADEVHAQVHKDTNAAFCVIHAHPQEATAESDSWHDHGA
jgi:cation diffusion facilitator family transporter